MTGALVEGDGAAGAAVDKLASLWAAVEESAPKALRFVVDNGRTAALIGMVVIVAMSAIRWWLTTRTLTRRVRYAMLPTETFDPNPEEIVRFASQLSRARRSVGLPGTRRAESVRLQLVSAPGGRMLQLIEGPARAESVLRIGGFAEVELRPLEDLDEQAMELSTPADPDNDEEAEPATADGDHGAMDGDEPEPPGDAGADDDDGRW